MVSQPATPSPSQPSGGPYITCKRPSGVQYITTPAICQQDGGTLVGPVTGQPLPSQHAPGTGRWCPSAFGGEWFSPYGDCGLTGALTAPLGNAFANVVGPIAGTGASPTLGEVASGTAEYHNPISGATDFLNRLWSDALGNPEFWKSTGLLVAAAGLVVIGGFIWLRDSGGR